MNIFAVLAPLAAEEEATSAVFRPWMAAVLAVLLLWVLAVGLVVRALRRRGKTGR